MKGGAPPIRSRRTDALGLIDRLDPRRGIGAAAAATSVVALLAIAYVNGLVPSRWFHPDDERNLPAFFSGVLLAVAAVLARLLFTASAGPRWRDPWWLMSGFLAFMAADEILSLHEKAERFTAVDWQTLYAPVMLLGAVGGLRTLVALVHGGVGYVAYAAGGVAWVASQTLEKLQWVGGSTKKPHYVPMMVGEEVLEMAGSLLLGIGMFLALKRRRRNEVGSTLAIGAHDRGA